MASYGSPYAPDMSQHPAPLSGNQIAAGTITYTTSQDASGRVVYHPFRAVPASYQTPNGIVSGIQWVPAEATQVLPTGAQPANAEFAASWNRGYLSREDERALKDWQRSEEKRRRKEEKESAKRVREYEKDRRAAEDLQSARDRDAAYARERRKSISRAASPVIGGGYPPATSGAGYGAGQYSNYEYSGGASDLARGVGDLDLGGRDRDIYGRDKINSNLNGDRPSKYAAGEQDRRRSIYNSTPGVAPPTAGGYSSTAPVYPSSTTPVPGYLPTSPRPGYPSTTTPGPGYPPTSPRPGYPSTTTPAPIYPPSSPRPGYSPTVPYQAPAAGTTYPASGGYGSTTAAYGGSNVYPSSPNMRPADTGYGSTGRGGYPTSPNMRPVDPPYPPAGNAYSSSGYPSSPGRSTSPFPRAPSPYAVGGGVYPRGHIMDGQPSQASMGGPPRSRATTPIPGAAPYHTGTYSQPPIGGRASPIPPSPRMGMGGMPMHPSDAQLASPEGFSRPRNAALAYTPFETMKIQNMDDLERGPLPRMPLVLQPHDVYNEDWNRLISDLALTWSGRLPISPGAPTKPATVAADLIEVWNKSFFHSRGVELVLFKGRERRSGPFYGTTDPHLPPYDDDYSDDSSSSSSSSESDLSGDERYRYGEVGPYGRPMAGQGESYEARRRRREKKAEKKRRRKEKKLRKKERASRKYALYLFCIQSREGYGGGSSMPGGLGMTM